MHPLTEAEQNRLIVAHMPMVEPIAACYRGQKGIPFEELAAAGRVGLVKAARHNRHPDRARFVTWAAHNIHGEIQHFVRDWESMDPIGDVSADGAEERIYEWSLYRTPFEDWIRLAATPEEIVSGWENLAHTRNALSGALLSLDKRERAILDARFIREPQQTLESIARHHKISYARTVFVLARALKKLKKILEAQAANQCQTTTAS